MVEIKRRKSMSIKSKAIMLGQMMHFKRQGTLDLNGVKAPVYIDDIVVSECLGEEPIATVTCNIMNSYENSNLTTVANYVEKLFDLPLGYIDTDIAATKAMYEFYNGHYLRVRQTMPAIKNVIFNNPATIVFWEDGTKTVVKAQDGDVYDPEKGLAMAITKKALGNKGNYCNELKKWLEKYEPSDGPTVINLQIVGDKYREALDAWNEFIRRHSDPVPDGDNN
jgi:hypothetical protein